MVPVILTWTEPDITVSELSLFLIVVFIDEVKEFKLPVLDSKLLNFCAIDPEFSDDEVKKSVTSTPFNIKDPVILALTIRIVFIKFYTTL